MDQLFDEVSNFNKPSSGEMSYQDLPFLSSNEIDGILAVLENQPPIAPFTEVKKLIFIFKERIIQLLSFYLSSLTNRECWVQIPAAVPTYWKLSCLKNAMIITTT